MSSITIPAKDGGQFQAYVAMPATLPAPTVIVIQEIFGVNEGIRGKCDWLASQGFIAVAPDLFWRLEPNVQLTDKTDAEWEKAFDLMNMFSVDKGIEDLKAVKHTFKGHAESTGKVGTMGYCLGGRMAYLFACRSDINAAVSYYGAGIDKSLAEANNLFGHLMLHIGTKDEYIPPEAQAKITEGLARNDKATVHLYEGMDHAFTRVGGAHYDADAAKLADDRTIKFFKKHLG